MQSARGFIATLAAAVVSAVLTHASAQAPPPPPDPRPARSVDARDAGDALDRALRARRFEEAEPLIESRIARGERDPVLLYNAACVAAQLGKLARAEERLMDCVKAGFRDFDTMEADADLEPVRASRTYEAIMEARERLEREAGPARPTRGGARGSRGGAPDPLAEWKRRHPEEFGDKAGYRYDSSEDGTIVYATFLDESSHARMKRTLDELSEHLLKAYFGKPPEEPVLVAIVRPSDAKEYLERPEIRGMYLHSARRLVSRDAGQSLQHEFVHLLHFAHMERTGQRHPVWIQEGIASLYEDYTLRADGFIEFHPNVRFNIARRQVTSKTWTRWKELVKLSGDAFMADAERHYPQVRSMFEFFARERRLEAFYRELCRTSASDRDGSDAIERAFGAPLATVEERWSAWMLERGAIDDSIDRNDASLGVSIEDVGDGVRIKSFVLKSAAKAAGLRVGDVIIEVDGTPVRNQDEMRLAVARLKVGEAISVRYRRDGAEHAIDVTPRPLGR